jgi:acetyltransferase
MSIRNLDRIFHPERIAVIGASDNPSGVGYSVLRNMIGAGYKGAVYPINPRREAVQGVPAFTSLDSLPKVPDLAVICTPSPTVPDLVRQAGELGTRAIVIISAGFREIGAEGIALEDRVRAEQARFDGMRIIGPNCLGLIVPRLKINLSFANAAMPENGSIAFISQSGALCTSVLDWALQRGIGFSYFVSIGNMLDVSFHDLIDYFGEDPETRSLLMYIESIPDARGFMSAARGFSRSKPIVAYKSGRFAESAKAAASHTGALAGEDAVYDAAFERAGIERVYEIDDMFECAELLGRQKALPKAARLAIVTNAGGPGVIATDKLMEQGGELAQLSEATMKKLNEALPPFWSHGNPVDVLGDAPPDRYARAMSIVLEDEQVDAVLVILTPQAMTDPTETARVIGEAARGVTKPVFAAWMGGRAIAEGQRLLYQYNVPVYVRPGPAVRAFMHLVRFARNQGILTETPRDIPVDIHPDLTQLKQLILSAPADGEPVLSEIASKELLAAYGIPVIRPKDAHSADEAVKLAEAIGYPIVLKVLSPQITHKTDVGGVVLNLQTEAEVRAAYDRIVKSAKARRPDADVLGVTVQKMVDTRNGTELIVGTKRDPVFGSILLVGMGGITAELFKDRALGLPPLNERLARRMLESLKTWHLLQGYRGRPAAHVDKLIEVLMKFSYLVANHPEISELDINPLLAGPNDVIALDARVVVERQHLVAPSRKFAHLAIRPYPEEFVKAAALPDGTPLTLRPLRPEDEPLWRALINRCSPQTLRYRFRYLFKEATHEMATRFVFTDYDRELAIMAELNQDGQRKFAGAVRLVANRAGDSVEYAALVEDAWQGRGVGGLLTDYGIEVARRWGFKRMTAETTADNHRMVGALNKRGFEMVKQDGLDLFFEKAL